MCWKKENPVLGVFDTEPSNFAGAANGVPVRWIEGAYLGFFSTRKLHLSRARIGNESVPFPAVEDLEAASAKLLIRTQRH